MRTGTFGESIGVSRQRAVCAIRDSVTASRAVSLQRARVVVLVIVIRKVALLKQPSLTKVPCALLAHGPEDRYGPYKSL